jgi:hypothetical protein
VAAAKEEPAGEEGGGGAEQALFARAQRQRAAGLARHVGGLGGGGGGGAAEVPLPAGAAGMGEEGAWPFVEDPCDPEGEVEEEDWQEGVAGEAGEDEGGGARRRRRRQDEPKVGSFPSPVRPGMCDPATSRRGLMHSRCSTPTHPVITSSCPPVTNAPPSQACANCGVTSASAWRRHPATNQRLCNPCGLYVQNHGAPRPQVRHPPTGT